MKKQSTSFLSFLLNEMEDPTAVVGMEQEPQDGNPPDAITLNIPLLVRLLEYAKEDAEDDMALHRVAEQLTKLAADGKTLTMDDYDDIVCNPEDCQDDAEAVSVPGGEADEMASYDQENEEKSMLRQTANKMVAVAKLKKDYADKMRWSREEAAKTGRDRSGHAAGAAKIKAHLKKQYGVDL